MFDHARRFRVVAALGLVLTLVQTPAWGGETIWTKAAGLACRVGALPRYLIPKLKAAAQQPPPIFGWENMDDAEWHLSLARMYEAAGPAEAYAEYKWLSRRHREDKTYADAAERLKGKLMEEYYRIKFDWNYNYGTLPPGPDYIELEEMIDRLEASGQDEAGKLVCIVPMASLPGATLTGDAPVTEDPLAVMSAALKPRPISLLFGVGVQSDAGLVVPEEPPFWLPPRHTHSDSAAPVLPEPMDMLPDSECSHLLIELGVIADLSQFLRTHCSIGGFIDSD